MRVRGGAGFVGMTGFVTMPRPDLYLRPLRGRKGPTRRLATGCVPIARGAVTALFGALCSADGLAPRHFGRQDSPRSRPAQPRRGGLLRQYPRLLTSSTDTGDCIPAFGIRRGPLPAPNPPRSPMTGASWPLLVGYPTNG